MALILKSHFKMFDAYYPIRVTDSGIDLAYNNDHGYSPSRGWVSWSSTLSGTIAVVRQGDNVSKFRDAAAAIIFIEELLKARFT